VSVPDLPAQPFTGVILANELLDNLPVRLFQRIGGRWWELRVVVQGAGFGLDEAPAEEPVLDRLVPDAPEGAIVPLHTHGRSWVHEALGRLERGVLAVFDYGTPTTAELASRPWTDWLRTYRQHGRGTGVLADPGEQDITCEVPFDQLPAPAQLMTQSDWLHANGIDELVEEGRRRWAEQAARPGLDAIRMRSRATEAGALLDPTGMGSFLVAQWRV
jgi:SAM-dependent MidA family methyltransferase